MPASTCLPADCHSYPLIVGCVGIVNRSQAATTKNERRGESQNEPGRKRPRLEPRERIGVELAEDPESNALHHGPFRQCLNG